MPRCCVDILYMLDLEVYIYMDTGVELWDVPGILVCPYSLDNSLWVAKCQSTIIDIIQPYC